MQLNLPESDIQIRENDRGARSVYDPIRGKWVALTPEEWVRQNFVVFLQAYRGFPKELMANEISLHLNGLSRRCDTVVFDRRLRPLVIVEYKAPAVALTQKVFDQIARYNIVMNAPYLIVSNGLKHYCCRFGGCSAGGYVFLRDIPCFSELVQNI